MVSKLADLGYRTAKRIVISVVGFSVLLVGVALLVLPGPAFVVIPIGLTILGLEFAWARRFLHRIKETGAEALGKVSGSFGVANGRRAPKAAARTDDEA